MSDLLVITEPGVYDIPEGAYHADPVPGGSLSRSGAKLLLQSPAKFDWRRTHGVKPKRAWDIGTAAHTEVLGTGAEMVVPVDASGVPYEAWTTKDAKVGPRHFAPR